MINREATKKLQELSTSFKSVGIIGPRQTGKTTLVKEVFTDKPYVSLENPDIRNFALEDPRGFLDTYSNGAVLDEVQRVPEIFSYLQEVLDNSNKKGLFILTGSNNLLLQQNISQSLTGRIAYLTLLQYSANELLNEKLLLKDDDALMIKGFYPPPVYDQEIPVNDWCHNYLRTYIEKDVRQIKNISNLLAFERFISLLAGRCGQELNMSSLAVEVGVDVKTIQSWLGILESTFIIYLLKPHHKNFNKTIVKRPKVYFYDTALVCSLLRISSVEHIQSHPLRGAIFENMVITEFVKNLENKGMPVNLFYWRDKTGHEIDLIIDQAGKLLPIEIKSGKTISSEYYKNIKYWTKLSNVNRSIVLYAGNEYQKRSSGIEIIPWREFVDIIK